MLKLCNNTVFLKKCNRCLGFEDFGKHSLIEVFFCKLHGEVLMCYRQLGPVLHSPVAGANGLRSSLLEAFVHYHAAQAPHMASMGLAPSLGESPHTSKLDFCLFLNDQQSVDPDDQQKTRCSSPCLHARKLYRDTSCPDIVSPA